MSEENPFASPQSTVKLAAVNVPELNPPQTVTASLSADDYLAFVTHLNNSDQTVIKLLRKQRNQRLLLGGVLFGLSFLLGPEAAGLIPLEVGSRVAGIVLLVSAVVSTPLAKWKTRRQYARGVRLGLYGETDKSFTAVLEDAGVRLTDADGDAIRYWGGVERVAATDEHLFIYFLPTQAAILPQRAFQSEAQFHGFTLLAERLWHEVRREHETQQSINN